ncbi:MAG: VOC family protein [Chloroflexi bacterium]|nr:MAG: VOC family protein [Chloroflexota bacterium]
MSKVEGLAEIVLWVADMESALEFYRDRFGLELMSPPELPNKFLMVAKPGGRVDRRSYDELENGFIEAGIEVRHGVHPVLKGVRTFYVDDPDGNEVEVIGPA